MKAPKPNKKEILSELESIRHSLLDDDVEHDSPNRSPKSYSVKTRTNNAPTNNTTIVDDDGIPVLDDLVIDDHSCPDTLEKAVSKVGGIKFEKIASSKRPTPKKESNFDENETVDLSKVIEDLKQTEAQLLGDVEETEHASAAETISTDITTSTSTNTSENSNILPGQQSLFTESLDDSHNQDADNESNAKTKSDTQSPQDTIQSSTSQSDSKVRKAAQQIFAKKPLARDQADNPFLPPHIRERLAQQKMVLESDARAQGTALASLKSHVSELTKQPAGEVGLPLYPFNKASDEDTNNHGSYTAKDHIIEEHISEDSTHETRQEKSEPSPENINESIKSDVLVSQILSANLDQINAHAIREPDKEKLIDELVDQLKPELETALRERLNEIL